MKLTKTAIDRLPIPERGKQVFYWDSSLPCFGVRVTPTAKSFIIQRRIKGKDRRINLGRYGHLTLQQAKREAQRLLGEIAAGRDPLAERAREALKGVTLGQAFERYLESRPLKAGTIRDMRRVMEGDFSDWTRRPLVSITREMVGNRHRKLGMNSQARANLAMRYLRAMFNFAMAEYTDTQGKPLLLDNPVKRLSETRSWYRVERRRTVIKPHELQPWMQAVVGLENTTARDFFLLLLFTGLRRGEALNLRWESVDLTWGALTVEDTKNHQPHTLPLSDYLLEMLVRRKAEATGPYVFQAPRGRLANWRSSQQKVIQQSGVQFCLHDLRRTFATVSDSLDIPGYAVKALLNHSNANDVTAGYIVTDVERLRKPMQKITDYMLKAGGLQEGAAITELMTSPGDIIKA